MVDQYLRLLEQAALAEDNFNSHTVEIWYESGRLQNEWRRQAAMNLVPTEELEAVDREDNNKNSIEKPEPKQSQTQNIKDGNER